MAKKVYYDNSNEGRRFQPGTLARGEHVDSKFDKVQYGFEQAEQDIRRAVKLPFVPAMKSQEILANPTQRRYKMIGFDENGDLMLHVSAQEALDTALELLDGLKEKLEKAWIKADERDPNGVEVIAAGTDDERRLDEWMLQVLHNIQAAQDAHDAADGAQSGVDDLAQNVSNIETTINNIVNETGDLGETLDALQISTQGNADSINTLQSEVAANTSNISTNAGAISTLQSRTIIAGNGLVGGGDLSADRSIRLGVPSTLSAITPNGRTEDSHTHNIMATSSRSSTSTEALLTAKAMSDHVGSSDHDGRYYTKSEVDTAIANVEASGDTSGLQSAVDENSDAIETLENRTLTAGNGLVGGGDLSADRSFRLGPPSTLSAVTPNGRTEDSHTHNILATTSRFSTSSEALLIASAMNDHRTSGDHDDIYYRKSEIEAMLSDISLTEEEVREIVRLFQHSNSADTGTSSPLTTKPWFQYGGLIFQCGRGYTHTSDLYPGYQYRTSFPIPFPNGPIGCVAASGVSRNKFRDYSIVQAAFHDRDDDIDLFRRRLYLGSHNGGMEFTYLVWGV